MKKLLTLLALTVAFAGCSKDDYTSEKNAEVPMQTVRLGAGIVSDEDTKAAISSEDGSFTWQENDQISVLATDGKFYTLTLVDGKDSKYAEFEGSIPQGYVLTGVAVYPATIAEGTENTIYDASTGILNYTLPSEYTWVKNSTNVPMVAKLEEGASEASFKQIGAVIRFTFNGMPAKAKIVFTAKNLGITGNFEIDAENTGTSAIQAVSTEGSSSTVTVNYEVENAGTYAEINIPVPTGKYDEFSVEVFDAGNNSLLKKDYTPAKTLNRATLLMMKTLDAGPIVISEVWPYFVDARVFWHKFTGTTQYALYIDDSEEPIIIDDTTESDIAEAVFGGDFGHKTSHKVAVAKAVNGVPMESTKSSYVEFTTGNVMQMTNNTGTKFICVGWDDVAIGVENSTVYDDATKRWSLVPATNKSDRNLRGYRVRLYSEDNTLLYEEVPFSGQVDYGGAFSNSSWIGKIGGKNVLLPTALSFGWLEPGKKYYFQVQTLAEPVVFNSPETGCFEPNNTNGYSVSSARGGSAWSKKVEVTTNDVHVASNTEVFYEGFEDMFFNNDLMNLAPAVVPQVLTVPTAKGKEGSDTKGGYVTNTTTAPAYKTWLASAKRKFSEQGFNTSLSAYAYGMVEKYTAQGTLRKMNEKAGSLNGWSVQSNKYDYRNVIPSFGNVRLGQSSSSTGAAYVTLFTPAIQSPKLLDDTDTPCVVTIRVCGHTTDKERVCANVGIYKYRDDQKTNDASVYTFSHDKSGNVTDQWTNNNTWTDADNYTHYPEWYEVKAQLYLRNGDVIAIDKANPTIDGETDYYKGVITIDDLLVEVGTLDNTTVVGERFYGTAPNNTNYDVWGLNGELPITFWMGPPALDQMNVDALTADQINAIKTAYFDPIVQGGYNLIETTNPYPNSMKKILEWCQDAGVKLLDKSIQSINYDGNVPAQAAVHMDRLSQYGNHLSYGGAYVGPDEPGNCQYLDIDIMNDAYVNTINNKAHIVNLLPSYANAEQLSYGASKVCSGIGHTHTAINNYETYIKNFVNTVSVNCVFFDHYCLKKSGNDGSVSRGNVKSKQYYDLDIIRHYSLEKGIPFLMITHGRPQWDAGYGASATATAPTVEKPTSHVYDEQRWLVWSQLAMGSKGVSYFCYWTPGGFSGGPFSWTSDGQKTRMYDILKDINQEILPIGRRLMNCHADGAISTNPTGNFALYENNGVGLTNYGPVLSLQKGNFEDVIAGCFRDASTGEYKVLVTHKAPAGSNYEAGLASIADLTIDTSMATEVKLHTVTLSNGHDAAATTVVSTVDVSGGTLTLNIPDGTAVLVEFPQTANVSYN